MTDPAGSQRDSTPDPSTKPSVSTVPSPAAGDSHSPIPPAAPDSDAYSETGPAGLLASPDETDEDLVPLMTESALSTSPPPAEWSEPPPPAPGDPSYYAHLFDEPGEEPALTAFKTFADRGQRINIAPTVQRDTGFQPVLTARQDERGELKGQGPSPLPDEADAALLTPQMTVPRPTINAHGLEARVTGEPQRDTGFQPVLTARQNESDESQGQDLSPPPNETHAALLNPQMTVPRAMTDAHGLEARVTGELQRDTGFQPVLAAQEPEPARPHARELPLDDDDTATVPWQPASGASAAKRARAIADPVRGHTFDVSPGDNVADLLAAMGQQSSFVAAESSEAASDGVEPGQSRSIGCEPDPEDENETERAGASAGGGGIWTIPLLCAGVGLIACCLLIPLADANRRAAYARQKLRGDLESLQQQVAVNDEFLRRVHDDPTLAERLAQRQMKTIRKGSAVLPLMGQPAAKNDAASMSPFQLVAVAAPDPLPAYKPVGGTLASLCYNPRARLYLTGVGLMMMAAGLVMGAGGRRGGGVVG